MFLRHIRRDGILLIPFDVHFTVLKLPLGSCMLIAAGNNDTMESCILREAPVIINDSVYIYHQESPGVSPPLQEKISDMALPEDTVIIIARRQLKNLSSATTAAIRELFKPGGLPPFRKAYDDHAVISAGPFVNQGGTIQVLDFRSLIAYDGASLDSKKLRTFAGNSEGPDFRRGVFTENGTCIFSSGDKRIRAFREGRELFSIPVNGELNSPVAATDSIFAYATDDGRVYVHNSDGSLRESHTVPLEGDPRKDFGRKPQQIIIGAQDRVYGITGDNHMIRFKNGKIAWNTQIGSDLPPGRFDITPLESQDGTTIYGCGKGGIAAVDCESGKVRWSADLGSPPAASPIADEQGNLYVLTQNGKITVFSQEGKKQREWETGEHPDIVNSAVPKLLIDRRGNLIVTPNPCRFQMYTREGESIVKLRCKDLFREVDYIQDFSLTPDGRKAIILAGSYSIGEMDLPYSFAQSFAEESQKAPGTENPEIIQEDEYIIIDGLRVGVKR